MKESRKRKHLDDTENAISGNRSEPITDAAIPQTNEGIKHKKVKKQNNKHESLESHGPKNNKLNEKITVDVSNSDDAVLSKQKSSKKMSKHKSANSPKQKQLDVVEKKAKIFDPVENVGEMTPRDIACIKVSKKNNRQSLQTDNNIEVDTETLSGNLYPTLKTDSEKTIKSKPKKVKKNKKAKKDSQAKESVSDDSGEKKSARVMASEYLVQWDQDREHWSFQKVRQVWLLQHLYQQDQVSDDEFKILLCYLENLRGKGRELTLQRAEMVVNKESDVDASSTAQDSVQYERARQILQMIT